MRTHYDNLKVAETATREVIKTSYRKLCLKHHPDRNPGNADALRIMQIINDAYDVLSDPVKRRAYDQELTLRRVRESQPRQNPQHSSREAWKRHQDERHRQARGPVRHHTRTWNSYEPFPWSQRPVRPGFARNTSRFTVGMAILLLVIAAANLFHKDGMTLPFASGARAKGPELPQTAASASETQSGRSATGPSIFRSLFPELRASPPKRSNFVRPATAPNGAAWPNIPNYVQDYPQAATAGESRVTLDNTDDGDDVFVKLISLREGKEYQVRTCFLPALSAFTLMSLSPGDYELRYRNLGTGEMRKTDVFRLKQTMGRLGIEYTTMRLSLFKTGRDDRHNREIAEGDF